MSIVWYNVVELRSAIVIVKVVSSVFGCVTTALPGIVSNTTINGRIIGIVVPKFFFFIGYSFGFSSLYVDNGTLHRVIF